MSTALRIALVSPYDYAYPGGVNEHIRHLAHHLRLRGHFVEVLAPTSAEQGAEDGVIKVEADIVEVPFGGSIARIPLSWTIWREVKALLSNHVYDIVHVHEPTTPVFSPAVLYYSRAVNVGTFHQYRETHAGYEFGRPLFRYFIKRLHGRIAVSRAARDFVESYFPADYRIIPNGIELAEFDNPQIQPWEALRNDGRLNILFVGRLEKRKGFRYLLRAFRLVKEEVPEARLLVAGAYDREDRLPYVRYVRHFRIRDVKFVGLVPEHEKARWYKTAHIFCAPSTGFESFGIVLAEAMAAGTPIVASDIAGYRDVIQHGVTGLLVPPEDEESLARALIRLLRDPDECHRLSEAARIEVQRYDWLRVTREIESFYWELLAREGRILPPIQGKVKAEF
ncbi:MAG: glycosyltransferase family 4 protein [Ardenticatenales bacterium]|nr:glycosyltransferase family 4 protein [Ardenticatenales bacterium]